MIQVHSTGKFIYLCLIALLLLLGQSCGILSSDADPYIDFNSQLLLQP